MLKLDPNTLPKIRRSEEAAVDRCPLCAGHLRRLGDPDPKTRLIAEKGFACTNPKCTAKVLEKYDRIGVTAFRVKVAPEPLAVKRVENLMKAGEERAALLEAEAVKKLPLKEK